MIAFLFPGQGSQHAGMGKPWVDHPSWELVDEASEIAGRDVGALLLDAPAEDLRETSNTQIATVTLCLVVLDAILRVGVEPRFVAGHSLGEYTALIASGALSFSDGITAVNERGTQIQKAAEVNQGGMRAVLGLEDAVVEDICASVDDDVWAANFNSPGQVVIAGSPSGLAAAAAAAKEAGATKVLEVAVSGAGHCPYLSQAGPEIEATLHKLDLRDPEIPVVSNFDGDIHITADEFLEILPQHVSHPVLWRHGLRLMTDQGVNSFVEVGPGKVLTATVKRTVPEAKALSVRTPGDLDGLIESLADMPGIELPHTQGEHLFTTERMVVSPSAGVYRALDAPARGELLQVGDSIGVVGESEVRSPFAGELLDLLVVDGERVTATQPVAWLRTA